MLLLLNGKAQDDENTLDKSCIQNGSTLYMLIGARGLVFFPHSRKYCDYVCRDAPSPVQIITGRNEVVAKVMFLHVCVCPQGGRVSASVHAGMTDPPEPGRHPPRPGRAPPGPGRPPRPGRTPPDQAEPPRTRQNPPRPGRHPPGPGRPPPGSRLQHTVYERPVRILLECILV